jgi:DNA-binding MarR family transcriptional regulator
MTTLIPARRRALSLGPPLQRVLSDLSPALGRATRRHDAEQTLSSAQARVLRLVRLHPGIGRERVSTELREDARVARLLVEGLVRAGLVEEGFDPSRPGTAVLRPTAAGRRRHLTWRARSSATLNDALDLLTAGERAAIALALPALEHLAVALGEA